MGIDAFVYCLCREQGLASEPPCEVIIDFDGQIAPANVDTMTDEEFDAYDHWRETSCEHDMQRIAWERIGSGHTVMCFQALANACTPELVALKLLEPHDDETSPAEWAELVLTDIETLRATRPTVVVQGEAYDVDSFFTVLNRLEILFRASRETNHPVIWC